MSLFNMSGLTLKWLFRRPFTRRYPFEPRKPVAGFRGAVEINLGTCIFCGICSKRCPTQAIEVDRGNKRWTIDRLRCLSCGLCTEVCPKKSLGLNGAHGVPTMTKDREVFQGAQTPPSAPAA